jgi:tellurite methyltransferase
VTTTHPHRQFWDTRYRNEYEPRPPSALLQRWLSRLQPSTGHNRALDAACGTGRNAVLLAEHGWHVVGVDISPVGLHIAQEEARQRAVMLDLLAVDLHDWLPPASFDLVCVFRFLDRSLCPRLQAALKPCGTLIYETFTIAQRNYEGGPRSDDFLLQPGELPTLFPGLEVLEYTEGTVEEDGRPRALAGLVGGAGHR